MTAPKLLLPLVVLLVVIAAGAFWLLDSSGGASEAGSPVAAAPPASSAPAEAGPGAPLADLATPASSGPETPARVLESAGAQREAALQGREIKVTVALSGEVPEDPDLSVVAFGRELLGERTPDGLLTELRAGLLSDREYVRVPVSGGTARLRLPDGMEGPQLLVDGRFLFLAEPVTISSGSELRVTPRLGACLVVHVEAPTGEEAVGNIALAGGDFSGRRGGWEQLSRETNGPGDVEFRAVDPELTWTLRAEVERLHAYPELGVELQPGVVHQMDFALTRGATVAGIVVDEDGDPLAEVEVRSAGGGGMWFGGARRSVETGADGAFELPALGPGELQIEAVMEGWVTARSEEFELGDGERRDDFRLVMSSGLAIAGQVVLPGGEPAGGAEVEIKTLSSGGGWGNWGGGRQRRVGEATSDDDGRFRITGLDEGKYAVRATLEVGDAEAAAAWRAAEDSVPAGREDVLLSLAGPIAFAGRVLDDRGEPVTSFVIEARAVRDGGPREEQSFDDEGGAFVFARVGPGEWEVTADAAGHVRSEPIALTLPGPGADLELRIERQASIAGRVFDSIGAPVASASVRADDGRGEGNPWAGPRGPRAETDDEGRFALEEITPGAQSLVASADGWADSLPLTLELAPGEAREGADVSLRIGGRIEGTVVTPEGDPLTGRRVTWGSNAMGFGSRGETQTDSSGQFAFDHVTPGEWAVSAAPSMSEMGERMRGRRDQSAFVEVMGEMVTETVAVADGEVVEVFLGGEPKRPVRVFGVVSRAGEAVAGAQVFAVSEGSAVFQGMKTSTTGDDGSYELVVDRPGGYSISANQGNVGVEVMVDVPRADEARVDLPIPLGRIDGTVRDPSGGRASGVRLNIQREDGLGRMRWAGNQATTDEDGRYAFEDLEEGRYTVRANVATWGGDSEKSWGGAVRGGVDVDRDETTSGVDFELETAGGVGGVVRGPDGSPAAGVTLFFRDSAGRLVSSVSGTVTDAVGRFEEDGLAPGTYSISARSEALAASEAVTVSVRSAETAEVELEVELGTTLVVTLEEEDGVTRRARVEVLDENGVEVGGLVTLRALQSAFNQGASTREQRVGPLPPGRYTVRAIAADGRTKERRVSLRNRDSEKQVRLRLDG